MASHPISSSELAGEAANFRRFNRMYTRFIGTLNEGLLNSDYSLAEARVLYELATRVAPKASDIAEGLGMDPAYLSRMLGKFERSGLLRKKASEQDGRYAELMLTAKGQSAFKKLNALSQEQAHTILQDLGPCGANGTYHCMRPSRASSSKLIATGHRSYCGRTAWAIWDGLSIGRALVTRSSTGGTTPSRPSLQGLWMDLSATSTPAGSAAGWQRSMARMSAMSSGQASKRTEDGEAFVSSLLSLAPVALAWETRS